MKSKFFALLTIILIPAFVNGQKLFSRNANVYFDATTKNSPERVEAKTNSGTIVIDVASAKVEAAVLMKSFLFEKALMQEHFNENYVESSNFPKAVFKGTLSDISKVNFKKDGVYKTQATGNLEFRGKTKSLTAPVTINVKAGKISGETAFNLTLKDFGISIPSVVSDKLSEVVKVTFGGDLSELK